MDKGLDFIEGCFDYWYKYILYAPANKYC